VQVGFDIVGDGYADDDGGDSDCDGDGDDGDYVLESMKHGNPLYHAHKSLIKCKGAGASMIINVLQSR
jgi:hypothetical protein